MVVKATSAVFVYQRSEARIRMRAPPQCKIVRWSCIQSGLVWLEDSDEPVGFGPRAFEPFQVVSHNGSTFGTKLRVIRGSVRDLGPRPAQ